LYRIWIQERDSRVWHGVTARPGDAGYRTACGLQFDRLVGHEVWPAREGEPGPAEFDRCQWCQAQASIDGR
jgi:hypothetical protein